MLRSRSVPVGQPFLVVFVVALLAGACGQEPPASPSQAAPLASGAPTVGSPPQATGAQSPSPTAAQLGAAPAGCEGVFGTLDKRRNAQLKLDAAHRQRTVVVHVPADLPSHAVPVVIVFHGYGGTAADAASQTGFSTKADANAFVAVYPQGVLNAWHGPEYPADPGLDQADVAFFAALLDRLAASDCIDMTRIYITGHSQGGGIAGYFACRFADRIRAAAVVSGVYYVPPCPPARPVPILAIHSMTDPVIPYWGGHPPGTGPEFPDLLPVEVVAKDWANLNFCFSTPDKETISSGIIRFTWHDCDAPVVLYKLPSGNHDWPGSTFYGPGANLDLNATDVIWIFFAASGRG
jgi:polyhydroxybutyrate depolymerase